MQTNKQPKQQFSEKQFIAFVFNYIAGFGFISVVMTMFDVGPFSYLVLGLTSFAILGVVLSFSRLSVLCGNSAYGGSYLIAKKAVGTNSKTKRFFVFLSGWNVSLTGSFNGVVIPAVLIFSFADIPVVKANNNIIIGLLVGGFLLFGLLTFISLFGLKINKKAIFYFAVIKWIVVIGGFILGIYLIGTTNGKGFVENNLIGTRENIDFFKIIFISLALTIAFAGTEDLASITPDVKSNNLRKCFLIAFGCVVLLYLVGFVIISGLDGIRGYGLALGNKDPKAINNYGSIYRLVGGVPLLVIYGLGLLVNSLASRLSMTITTARKYVALAQDGFLPSFLAKTNKHNEYHHAVLISNLMTLLVMLIMVIIPFLPDHNNNNNSLFNAIEQLVTVTIEMAAAISLIQYFITFIFFFMIFAKKENQKLIPLWEKVSYVISFALVSVLLFVPLFPFNQWTVFNTFKIVVLICFYLLGVGFFGYAEWKNKNKYQLMNNNS
ncbi:APC family permease [Mycoplasmoides genitalium]|uniref:Uncharacterized protein MG226 n=3 Tax=Mycoplasmoides genitalium TaxID=2097 RepID=Y226_MYCGE|nr:APC family permease [Mycoplasmoides genitalium]P47468.2 RecName: Full=Uncharacterized protein MG226 [Mycoplasmoides genitalium G37]AAC71447.2 amino acid-polyamine-organocation (APC) permease family protein [Mycoplasmoides genitalium G37]ABY79417.1 amino acid-polyamine-organocation (APC) permease family protein [synthetic Mycoplasma genitalium JCVI-1.0]AFQ04047.1 amino acid-polyamine-organocation (APC) permease family protein [Mycoplasmoides genitalium M6320]